MATDWESILRSWVRKPSANEEAKRDKTEKEIRQALAASGELNGVTYKVYAKGSYANNTNVRLDYDVDIAVECIDFSYYSNDGVGADIRKMATLESKQAVRKYKGQYTSEQFKKDVEDALVLYYGRSAVTRGNIAMRVRESKTTLPADVVACFEYHYNYDIDFMGEPRYHKGTRVYKDSGGHIHNWSEQQKECGNTKNNATGRRYKRMVRALKRLENTLVAKGLIEDLPSFFIECLVYNVPNSHFGNAKYYEDMRNVLAYIFNATRNSADCSEWLEVSERKWLFHPDQGWTYEQAHSLADAAWDFLGYD